MSTVTGPAEFGALTEAAGTGDDAWANENNMLTDLGTFASAGTLIGYPTNETTNDVRFYNWSERATIPNNAVIENIEISVSGTTDVTYWAHKPSCRWSVNGTSKSDSFDGGISFSGDLSYWGITNAEALAAIKATGASSGVNELYVRAGQVDTDVTIKRVLMTVTWSEREPAGGVLLGGLS